MISLPKDIKNSLQKLGLKKGMSVMQFGVEMRGHIASELQGIVGDSGKVYAVDVLPDSLLSIRKFCSDRCYHHVEPIHADFEKFKGVPLPNNSIDCIIIIHAMWRTQNLENTLNEAKRLLKSGGKLFIMDWQEDTKHPIGQLSPQKLNALAAQRHCAASGCKVIERIIFNKHHWGYLLTF